MTAPRRIPPLPRSHPFGGRPILTAATVEKMITVHVRPKQMAVRPGVDFGGSVLADPATPKAGKRQAPFQWGDVYGHNRFIDRTNSISSLLMTNTAQEGMIGPLTVEVPGAVYGM